MSDKQYVNMSEITFQDKPITPPEDIKNAGGGDLLDEWQRIDPAMYSQYTKHCDTILEYLVMTEDPRLLGDESQRIILFAKLSFGLRKAGEAVRWTTYQQKVTYAQRKEAVGIAALDEYSSYLSEKRAEGQKERATNEMRTYYTHVSKNVMQANRKEAMVNAMHEHLLGLKYQFAQAISTLRSIHYSSKDSSLMSSASVNIEEKERDNVPF
jgi:hypothetical protein